MYEIYLKIKDKTIKIIPASYKEYEHFKKYHYLKNINNASKCWLVMFENEKIGFLSVLPLPQKRHDGRLAYKGHRTIIRPKYRGMGIGTSVTNYIAKMYFENGYAYYTNTTNEIFGMYRNKSKLWKATKHNGRIRKEKDYEGNCLSTCPKNGKVSYCHEYVGE